MLDVFVEQVKVYIYFLQLDNKLARSLPLSNISGSGESLRRKWFISSTSHFYM